MQALMRGAAIAAVVVMTGCGGSSSSPSAPSSTTPSGTNATSSPTTITIVGSNGNQAYNPNPVQVSTGNQVMWKNNDTLTHHIVMDDGSADAGTIAPGTTSRAMTLTGSGGNYHCTIHPSMVGSINGQSAPNPPNCPNGYCG